jgi:hypothetical protein
MAGNEAKLTEDQKFQERLTELRAWFFASKYYSVKNWAIFNQVELPKGIDPDALLDWEPQKQTWLAKDKIRLEGVGEDYKKRLRDRLDTATAMKEKLISIYGSIETAKDVNQATLALKKLAEIEDEVAKLLKINSYEANIYEKNKTSTENLLREKSKAL